jgi:hypothetical protein
VARRAVWLVTGAVVGAGSSLWAEHKVRRTIRRTADAVQPDALVRQVGRVARDAVDAAGTRMGDAVEAGRIAKRRREAELWAGLATAGRAPGRDAGGDTEGGRASGGDPVAPGIGAAGGADTDDCPRDAPRARSRGAALRRRRSRRRRAGAPATAH